MSERGGVPVDVAGFRADPGAARGPGGYGPPPPPPSYVVGLPTQDRPTAARDFQLFSTLTGLDLAAGPTPFPDTVQLPGDQVGVIRSISILANSLLVTSDILYTLRFNQTPVAGWNRLTINPRAAGSVEVSWPPQETAIPVPAGAKIDVVARVLDGGTYQVSVALHGWWYSIRLAAEAARAGGA